MRFRAREHYVRKDLEPEIFTDGNGKHLILVDYFTICHQLDLFEQEEFTSNVDIILLGSTIKQIQKDHRRLAKRIQTLLLDDPNKRVKIFSNQHCQSTFSQQEADESIGDYQSRLFIKAALWYTEKLRDSPYNVTFITNETKLKERALEHRIRVATVQEFVKQLFPSLLDVLAPPSDEIMVAKKHGAVHEAHWKAARIKHGLSAKTVFQGKLNVRFLGVKGKAQVRCEGLESQVTLIGWGAMSRAVHGDIVAIQITEEADDQVFGKVVGILEENRRQYCGALEETDQESGWVLFVPTNKRIPKIRIRPSDIAAIMDQRIVVSIDEWFEDSVYPQGHFVKSLGLIGDLEVETKVLLLEHEVPHEPWSPEVLRCLPPSTDLDPEQYKVRVDLRSKCICNIDPPGCKDIDDALHCERLPNGNFEVGVHIADVAFYVRPGTALDEEGRRRSTSVYLVDRRIDMLPQLLSTDLCSLKPGVDRFAFSVVWELDKDGNIINAQFFRSVIRNRKFFDYYKAQDRIDDPEAYKDQFTCPINDLNQLAIKLKAKRFVDGALSLNSPQPKFELGENKKPTKLSKYKIVQAHSLIEEFMLLANITVAKKILETFPQSACLRRHPVPTSEMMTDLMKSAKVKGFDLKITSNKLLNESLDNCVIEHSEEFNKVIRMIATRCMTQAVYFSAGSHSPEEFAHYGLATPIYTHFTSPIRRYSDIIVHRQLANAINIDAYKESNLVETCDILNRRHRMAQYISRDSNKLFTLKFFMDKEVKTGGIITSVRPTFLNVYIPEYVMDQRVNIVDRTDIDNWTLHEDKLVLERTTAPHIRFQVFDEVRVWIRVNKNKHRARLVVTILDDAVDAIGAQVQKLKNSSSDGPPAKRRKIEK